jgi:peptide/nickel transport system ATP-binding protein
VPASATGFPHEGSPTLPGTALRDGPTVHGSAAPAPLLEVSDLTLEVARTGARVVRGFELAIARGEIVGIVGESGSGKTLAARSILRLEPPAIRRVSGSIRFEGRDLAAATPAELRSLRGARIGMVFQEPMTSLNPAMMVGRQLEEGLAVHRGSDLDAAARRARILEMLRRVGIADPAGALSAYPHQFSGGMRQRIMLASVMLLAPALLIADEPTTALDAVIQRDVLDLMLGLARDHDTALLLISHDLPMVARYTHRIVVMAKGEIVEEGRTEALLEDPRHPYTRGLLGALPRRLPARPRPEAPPVPVIEARDLVVEYPGRPRLFGRAAAKRAVHGVSLHVAPGEVVALVGGSGSGKTTIGRALAGLSAPTGGEIRYAGQPISPGNASWLEYRRSCQMIFQDPYSSLDPRMTVGAIVDEALRIVPDLPRGDRTARVGAILDEVGLGGADYAGRYPHELSGGQRQRVAIARALVRRPALVIADEPVSALDVTVRAQILDLFADLQKRYGFSCLFISHDLGVVEQVADRVIVMHEGRIAEEGDRDQVFDHPQHAYTRRLLSAIPALERAPGDGHGVRLRWRLEETPGRSVG